MIPGCSQPPSVPRNSSCLAYTASMPLHQRHAIKPVDTTTGIHQHESNQSTTNQPLDPPHTPLPPSQTRYKQRKVVSCTARLHIKPRSPHPVTPRRRLRQGRPRPDATCSATGSRGRADRKTLLYQRALPCLAFPFLSFPAQGDRARDRLNKGYDTPRYITCGCLIPHTPE